MYKIMYQPRFDDAVCVASFDTLDEAQSHMKTIEFYSKRAVKHHYIMEQ